MFEAVSFWKEKKKMSHEDFDALSPQERVRAFSVPGLKSGKDLNTVFKAFQNALEHGTTLRQFKKECAGIFLKIGWVGEQEKKVELFFNTNILTAYSVGNYRQLIEDIRFFPFWSYSAVEDQRTRPTHLAMNGKVFPAAHPVWDKWFPPNGLACRCTVIGKTKTQVEREGITVCGYSDIKGEPDNGFNINSGKIFYGN